MKHLLAIAFVALAACSTCCAPNAQSQLDAIKREYLADTVAERTYCVAHTHCDALHRADYNASASLLIAESDIGQRAIAKARADVDVFTKAVEAVKP